LNGSITLRIPSRRSTEHRPLVDYPGVIARE
jgi:hypothetical protein